MEISKLSALRLDAAANILLYGVAGAGKTTAITTLPSPVLLLSSEGGLLSIASSAADIDVVEVKTVADIREAYAFFTHGRRKKNTRAWRSTLLVRSPRSCWLKKKRKRKIHVSHMALLPSR